MSETEVKQLCEYDPSILHKPEKLEGPVLEVSKLVDDKVQLKLELKDERTIIGTFTAFDKFGNFALANATEHFRDQKREIPMVIVPIDYVVKVSMKPAEPKSDKAE